MPRPVDFSVIVSRRKALVVAVKSAHDDCLYVTAGGEADFGLIEITHVGSTLSMARDRQFAPWVRPRIKLTAPGLRLLHKVCLIGAFEISPRLFTCCMELGIRPRYLCCRLGMIVNLHIAALHI